MILCRVPPAGGFSNKILGLVYALYLGDTKNEEVKLTWSLGASYHEGYENNHFNELFENDIVLTAEEAPGRTGRRKLGIESVRKEKFYMELDENVLACLRELYGSEYSRVRNKEQDFNINLCYNCLDEEKKDLFLKYFNQLIVKPEILDEVSEYYEKIKGDDLVSMQIRSWTPNLKSRTHVNFKYKRRYFSLAKYENIIDHNLHKRFFITSDDNDNLRYLKDKYGDRILSYGGNGISLKEDFKQMLIASKTEKLYGTYMSTFSELIWWFSQASQEVELI